ncbi:hypothetical protein BDW22DRAFT_662866 [Trametopsis cervina]|nr:hypothetical protein BDW22DRAFT_662866 [Trametopsis cervina]
MWLAVFGLPPILGGFRSPLSSMPTPRQLVFHLPLPPPGHILPPLTSLCASEGIQVGDLSTTPPTYHRAPSQQLPQKLPLRTARAAIATQSLYAYAVSHTMLATHSLIILLPQLRWSRRRSRTHNRREHTLSRLPHGMMDV